MRNRLTYIVYIQEIGLGNICTASLGNKHMDLICLHIAHICDRFFSNQNIRKYIIAGHFKLTTLLAADAH